MHPRVSANNICFAAQPLEQDLVTWRQLQAVRIGVLDAKLVAAGWDEGIAKIRQTDHIVATVVHQFLKGGSLSERGGWAVARDNLKRSIDAAARLDAETLYLTSGNRSGLSWEDAADAFCELIAPCVDAGKAAGVPVLIEPAVAIYADLNITSSLRDTVKLAEMADLGVCIDIFSCWTEAGLQDSINRAMPRCRLVQVSDFVTGDRTVPCRAVPGDGNIPLRQMLGWILDAGFSGAFDLELLGPRIEAEGQAAASARSAEWIATLLADHESK